MLHKNVDNCTISHASAFWGHFSVANCAGLFLFGAHNRGRGGANSSACLFCYFFIEYCRGWHRGGGGQFYLLFALLRALSFISLQQNEPFLPSYPKLLPN